MWWFKFSKWQFFDFTFRGEATYNPHLNRMQYATMQNQSSVVDDGDGDWQFRLEDMDESIIRP